MNIALWTIAGLLAAVFALVGTVKLVLPRPKLIAQGQAWAEDFSDGAVKLIGLCELLGALGLILPPAVDIAPVLTPLGATGLAVLMMGAAIVHARRGETRNIIANLALAALAAFIAVMRFGPYSF